MKKFLTLLCLLTCALTGWAAGSISETPTTELTTGYYVIRVFSNKTKADGNLLFFNTSDNIAYTNAPATTNESYDTESIKKYIWKVTVNSDKTIQLSSYVAPTYYFGSLTNKGAQPSNNNNIMSTTAGNYTLTAAEEASYPNCFYLTTPGNNTTHYAYNQGAPNNNAVHTIGFWSSKGNEAIKCRFHAIDLNDVVTITYNIKYNGEKKLTNTIENCLKGCTFPTPTNLPSFASVETVPSGQITQSGTYDVDATVNTPFKTGNHWYYFSFAKEQGNDNKGYLYNCNYNDATTNYIALGQTSGVTEKKLDNDKYLWRIEGNPFDGFTFYVKDGKHLVTPAVTGNGGTNYPYLATTTPSDQFDTFTLSQYTGSDNTNAVIVRVKDHDTWVMNSRDQKLAYWTGANNGSSGSALRFEDTLPDLTLHTLGDKSYATYYLPFAAKAPEGVTAYAGVVNNGSVQLTAFTNGVIPANTGALFVANSDVTTATFTLADNSEATTINNDLKGVLTTTELSSIANSDQVRIFSKKGDVAGFYKPNTTITTLAANKVYVMAPANSTASLALNFGQEITGIDQVLNGVVENNENNAAIYDLTGRRVAKAVKGVYVKNGKKFIVK